VAPSVMKMMVVVVFVFGGIGQFLVVILGS
jgi:hypothetical protein